MRKSDGGVQRSTLWTAWDANTRWCRCPAKLRKSLRRIIKHQQRQLLRKQTQEQIEEEAAELKNRRS